MTDFTSLGDGGHAVFPASPIGSLIPTSLCLRLEVLGNAGVSLLVVACLLDSSVPPGAHISDDWHTTLACAAVRTVTVRAMLGKAVSGVVVIFVSLRDLRDGLVRSLRGAGA